MLKRSIIFGTGLPRVGSCGYPQNSKFLYVSYPLELTVSRLSTFGVSKPWRVSSGLLLLSLSRITRTWNQAGQKHAGEPDTAKTVLAPHNVILWLLVLATYLDVIRRLSRRAMPWASRQISSGASIALGITALSFKIAFTKADAPELLEGLQFLVLQSTETASLVAQARAVFTSIAIMIVLTSLPLTYGNFCRERKYSGMVFDCLNERAVG